MQRPRRRSSALYAAALSLAGISIAVAGLAFALAVGDDEEATDFVASFPGHCSASVIGSRHVLSAAHCGLQVATGLIPRSGQSIAIRACIEPDDWSLSNGKDVSLCELAQATDSPRAPRLADASEIARLRVGDTVELIGYGPRPGNKRTPAKQVSKGRLSRVGTALVIKTESDGVCPGDSGGPVLGSFGKEKLLVGVISSKLRRVEDCGAGEVYAVRSDSILAWMKEQRYVE